MLGLPPAWSPDCTLLSCMSRLAPFFSSKSVASTLLTAAAQWRADFPVRDTLVSADCTGDPSRPSHQEVSSPWGPRTNSKHSPLSLF